jgi:hypothetical protein
VPGVVEAGIGGSLQLTAKADLNDIKVGTVTRDKDGQFVSVDYKGDALTDTVTGPNGTTVATAKSFGSGAIAVTISGMYSPEPLHCAVSALGASRVMFSADFPFEDIKEAGHFMDDVAIDTELREAVAWRNAARILNIKM